MTDFDKVRAILDAATPGPWTESGRDIDHDKMVAEGRNPGDACGLGCEVEGPPEPWLRGQFHLHADARAIVVARNLAPELLAVAEAAEHLDRMCGREGMAAAADAVAAALDALYAKMKETL